MRCLYNYLSVNDAFLKPEVGRNATCKMINLVSRLQHAIAKFIQDQNRNDGSRVCVTASYTTH